MGGSWEPLPSVFQIVRRQRRAAPPFLAQLIHTLSYIFSAHVVKLLDPDHARSGYVKWPHLIKSLNAGQSYTDWTIALKLSAIDIRTSVYETYISEAILEKKLLRNDFFSVFAL